MNNMIGLSNRGEGIQVSFGLAITQMKLCALQEAILFDLSLRQSDMALPILPIRNIIWVKKFKDRSDPFNKVLFKGRHSGYVFVPGAVPGKE